MGTAKDKALKMAIKELSQISLGDTPALKACKEALQTNALDEMQKVTEKEYYQQPAQDDDLMSGKWVRFNEDDDTSRLLMELEVAMNGVEGSAKSPAVIDVLQQAVNYFKKGKKYHVLPIDDVEPHEESEQCKCNPTIEIYENNKVVIHISFDGREALEQPTVAELNDEYLRDTYVEGLNQPAQDTETMAVAIALQEQIRQLKEQPAQELYKCHWVEKGKGYCERNKRLGLPDSYTHPHQWQGLTDGEAREIYRNVQENCIKDFPSELNAAWFKAVKEKNNG